MIRRKMNYMFPAWRSAEQVLQSKCLHIATNAPWYICNKQNHGDLGDPFFTDQIRSEGFDPKCGETLIYAAWQMSMLTEG